MGFLGEAGVGLFKGGLAPAEPSLLGFGLIELSDLLVGGLFGRPCGFCSCINSLGATGFLMPEGTPGRLPERLGPVGLLGAPDLFGPPPRVGAPGRLGTPVRPLKPGRF